MKHIEIREVFNSYFKEKRHHEVLSAPLVPAKDPTLLFTNAGMNQFKQVFVGKEKRNYNRAVSIQKCMRVSGKHNDFNEVGKTEFHHTFFEMLGNFSFGDYFKEKAIEYSWDLLINHFKFNSKDLWITVYKDDDEAFDIWKDKIGIPTNKIVKLGDKDNFWQMGEVGPCGPCSEIHFDKGENFGVPDFEKNEDRFVEIWNLVFMQYLKDIKGKLNPLPKPSIDTGMGLERLTALLQGKDSNYKTDLFVPIISFARELISLSASDKETEISLKVIADHTRALTFLISDGVIPTNDGRGYVLRRLLRRAARHGKMLGFTEPFIYKISNKVIDLMGQTYPELYGSQNFISEIILSEEKRFERTLTSGLKRFEDILSKTIDNNKEKIQGKELFKLSDTYGFPIDFAIDLAMEKDIGIDIEEYEKELNDQKDKSRRSLIKKKNAVKQLEDIDVFTSDFIGYEQDKAKAKVMGLYEQSEQIFKKVDEIKFINLEKKYIIVFDRTPFYAESGGQKGDIGTGENKTTLLSVYDTQKSESGVFLHYARMQKGSIKIGDILDIKIDKIRRQNISIHHSLTHLLHSALRETLGNHIKQSGSLVEQNKLRFDFTHYKALSNEEIIEVENLINAKIRENLLIRTESLQYEDAVKQGAIAIFDEKYSDVVRLVKMGDFSKELCGGTHLNRSGEIGLFKILNESSISSGIRRIEAVGGNSAFSYIQERLEILGKIQNYFEKKPKDLFDHLKDINEKLKLEKKENKKSTSVIDIKTIIENSVSINSVRVAIALIENVERKQLSAIADEISNDLNGIAILFSNLDKKSMVVVSIVNKVTNMWSADVIIKKIVPLFNGRGGGKKKFAQAGGDIINSFKSLQDKIIDILK